MQYCTDCRIHISTKTDKCPLCQKDLTLIDNQNTVETYPCFEPIKAKSRRLVKIISMIACFLIGISIVSNVLTWNGNLWCAIFSAVILYAWGLGLLTFKKRVHLGLKLTAHAIAMPILLVVINTFAYNTEPIHKITWAVSYGMPIIFICFILAINIIMVKRKHNLQDYLLYQFSLCVIGFIPLILVLCGVAKPLQPSIIAAGCSLITVIALVVFINKIIKSEFERKLHI